MRYGTVECFSSVTDEREDRYDSIAVCLDYECVNAGGLLQGGDTEVKGHGDGDDEESGEEEEGDQEEEDEGGEDGQEGENGEG